jgi:hypothetical protein
MKNEAPKTPLDRFRIEEAKINEDVAESEKSYNRIIREQEGILAKAKAVREAAAGVLKGMIADYEKIDMELEAKEMKRLEAEGLTKAALNDGQISAEKYFNEGLTAGEITAKAQAITTEKLVDLRSAVRAKAVKLLEAEAAELEAEYQIFCAERAPAATMRTRLAGLLKALEASLNSSLGIGGEPAVGAIRYAKLRELRNATKGYLPGDGDGWKDYDLAGLKRLRLDPCWPVEQIPELEKIIAEVKMTGRSCRLMLDSMDRKNPVNVMWS